MNEAEERVISPRGQRPKTWTVEITACVPRTMAEYIGQQAMREKLEIFLEAARRRGRSP